MNEEKILRGEWTEWFYLIFFFFSPFFSMKHWLGFFFFFLFGYFTVYSFVLPFFLLPSHYLPRVKDFFLSFPFLALVLFVLQRLVCDVFIFLFFSLYLFFFVFPHFYSISLGFTCLWWGSFDLNSFHLPLLSFLSGLSYSLLVTFTSTYTIARILAFGELDNSDVWLLHDIISFIYTLTPTRVITYIVLVPTLHLCLSMADMYDV